MLRNTNEMESLTEEEIDALLKEPPAEGIDLASFNQLKEGYLKVKPYINQFNQMDAAIAKLSDNYTMRQTLIQIANENIKNPSDVEFVLAAINDIQPESIPSFVLAKILLDKINFFRAGNAEQIKKLQSDLSSAAGPIIKKFIPFLGSDELAHLNGLDNHYHQLCSIIPHKECVTVYAHKHLTDGKKNIVMNFPQQH